MNTKVAMQRINSMSELPWDWEKKDFEAKTRHHLRRDLRKKR
jgi:hypothetical protein